jgi:phytoene/squalene synthetase
MSAQGSSFYWPMRLAREPQRSGLFAIYAWCRHLDDIVDGDWPADDKARSIALWRDYFLNERSVAEMSGDGLMVAMTLTAAIAAHDLPSAHFLAILNGLEMDLAGEMRAPPLAMLEAYSHAVASAPGELCLAVLGWRGAHAHQYSAALGEAVQYTNILRDVDEDAQQGRLYIPREALDAAGIDAQDPGIVVRDGRFGNAWLAIALMAEAKFHLADSLLPDAATRAKMKPALAMMGVYRTLWKKLRKRGWQPGAPKLKLTTWRAVVAALSAAWFHR